MSPPLIARLCVAGVGLMGGSLARALRAAGRVGEIVGWGRDPAHLERALALGVIDRFEQDAAAAAAGADMVVLAVPVGATGEVLACLQPGLSPEAVVTDVGSTKGSVVADVRRVLGGLPPWFVPGHPIAGTEQSGVEASVTGLFAGRRVILTPEPETAAAAVARVRAMWEAVGAQVVETSAAHHDAVLAATSHLPHMLAYALVDTLARMDDSAEIFEYAAGGFADFTRIASSNPAMWHDICLANREALVAVMDRFLDDLARLREAVAAGDSEFLRQTFERAKAARDAFAARFTAPETARE